ncbi:MAG: GGDEF domain-containing protein [Bdellovibrionaceae bacterium]|nr:GGDEF domain-containing protein [Pseudobdellovibrionaceae bacterium]NUM59811.1 GGDEF domain-containing protein [Pseudobdellovibrionaceae bacterium]
MDFSVFDNSFDVIVVYDSNGIIRYGNSAFYLFTELSPARAINKLDIAKVFSSIEGEPLKIADFVNVKEVTPIKHVRFTTKNIENGLAQYTLSPAPGNEELQILFLKDLTIEEDLHRKYRREMVLKDKKIEEMDSLIELLQNTRLVKEPVKIVEEFTRHLLKYFSIGIGFIKDSSGVVSTVINSKQLYSDENIQNAFQEIKGFKKTENYLFLKGQDLHDFVNNCPSYLHGLVIIPINSQGKEFFEVYLPFSSLELLDTFDHEKVTTLAEQMKLLLQNMALEKLSIFDDLTKLYNSRFFREKLNEYTSKYEILNLVLLDIDFFKKINDNYGHLGGDAVLIQVGQILKSYQEKEVLISRVGGEEFAILAPNQSLEETLSLASKISEQVKQAQIPFDSKTIKLTMSFGISNWNPEKYSVRDFYKKADEALYTSKTNGRDRITILNCA